MVAERDSLLCMPRRKLYEIPKCTFSIPAVITASIGLILGCAMIILLRIEYTNIDHWLKTGDPKYGFWPCECTFCVINKTLVNPLSTYKLGYTINGAQIVLGILLIPLVFAKKVALLFVWSAAYAVIYLLQLPLVALLCVEELWCVLYPTLFLIFFRSWEVVVILSLISEIQWTSSFEGFNHPERKESIKKSDVKRSREPALPFTVEEPAPARNDNNPTTMTEKGGKESVARVSFSHNVTVVSHSGFNSDTSTVTNASTAHPTPTMNS